jgi:hypothetical protein
VTERNVRFRPIADIAATCQHGPVIRLERERWALGSERWPHLQLFLSQDAPDALLGDASSTPSTLKLIVDDLDASKRAQVATECWDFLSYFDERYDDFAFLRDGFGVSGRAPADHRGKGQAALARVKLLYAALAEAVRAEQPDWKPHPYVPNVR